MSSAPPQCCRSGHFPIMAYSWTLQFPMCHALGPRGGIRARFLKPSRVVIVAIDWLGVRSVARRGQPAGRVPVAAVSGRWLSTRPDAQTRASVARSVRERGTDG
jgi:hypothetical protein